MIGYARRLQETIPRRKVALMGRGRVPFFTHAHDVRFLRISGSPGSNMAFHYLVQLSHELSDFCLQEN